MSKYLVTGGAGFIGSNLVDRLVKDGHEVIVVDNLSSGFLEYLPLEKITFIPANISYYQALNKYFEGDLGEGIDGVFHLAAQSRIQPAIQNPDLAHDNNVTGVYNILKLMRAKKIPKIVFSSSSSIYGLQNECPQVEDMPADCLNPYSVSKFIGERYIKTWCTLYGIEAACLRYFNVWGPREVTHLKDVAPIIGLFFRQTLKEKNSTTIVGDGKQRRDFTHVSDVIEANIKAMQCVTPMHGEVFNIGTGKNYSILELADIVLNSLGLDEKCKDFIQVRPAESRETKANNSKAKEWFGWEPKTVLEEEINIHRDYYLRKWKLPSLEPPEMKKSFSPQQGRNLQSALRIIKEEGDDGAILEFGVFEGGSLSDMASFVNEEGMKNEIYGFDSFSGMPKDEYHWKKGGAASSLENTETLLTQKLGHMDNITLVKGIYEESFVNDINEKINIDHASLIHIDCDLSGSFVHVLNCCKSVMRVGTFIAVHDWYYLAPSWHKFCEENPNFAIATILNQDAQQVVFRVGRKEEDEE